MLKNKLVSFIAIRVLICCILLSIIDVILLEYRWHALAGLILGSVFGVLRFGSNTWIFEKIIPSAENTAEKSRKARMGMLGFLTNQILLLPVLFAAYFLNQWFFAGIVAGILLVPFVIMLNCITEFLNITSNNLSKKV